MLKTFVNFIKDYKKEILSAAGVISTLLMFTLAYRIEASFERMQNQIKTPQWKISSTLYADAPILSIGTHINSHWLIDYLQRLKYVQTEHSVMKPGQYTVRKEGIVFLKRGNASAQNNSPILVTFDRQGVRRLVQLKTGSEITQVSMDPLALADVHGSSWEKQNLLQLYDLPEYVLNAVVAIEDRRFYNHMGVDFRAIARAAWNNTFRSGQLQGGSTITQQVVKNFYLTPKKSIRRKITEALMAMMMERKYSKEKILEFYVNNVYLGKCGTFNIRGFQEASRLYFKKDARYLSVPEAALLAGMIQAPLRYNPYSYPQKAKSRRDTVLLAMKNTGEITPEDYEKYIETLIHVEEPDEAMARAPYFINAVLRQLPEEYSSSQLHAGGYKINTTLDMSLQKIAEESLSNGLAAIDKIRLKRTRKEVQGCLIAVEPNTGYVRAFVGGRRFSNSQFDRITQALRHPGSSFKPFVYAMALESAFDPSMPYYSAATLIADEPLSMQLATGVWEPENYNRQYYGVVTARQALAYSMNVATARLAQQVGVDKISTLSKKAGLQNAKPYPSVALGAFEVTPWDLIEAYTIFANGGKKVDLNGVRTVVDSNGHIVYQSQIVKTPVLHEQTAYLITNMMQSVVTSGTGASLGRFGFTGAIAGKTGTSNEYRDAWFVGYTPDLICLVWVGYDDNTPVKMTGAEAALPIWASFMKKALAGVPPKEFSKPGQMVERVIDPTTGKLATWDCVYREGEIFIKGTEPMEFCTEEDHYLPPESFTGPRLRRTPVLVQERGEPTVNVSYTEDEILADPEQESESNDGYLYIAAPEKETDVQPAQNVEKHNAYDNDKLEGSENLYEQGNFTSPGTYTVKKLYLKPPKNIDAPAPQTREQDPP